MVRNSFQQSMCNFRMKSAELIFDMIRIYLLNGAASVSILSERIFELSTFQHSTFFNDIDLSITRIGCNFMSGIFPLTEI